MTTATLALRRGAAVASVLVIATACGAKPDVGTQPGTSGSEPPTTSTAPTSDHSTDLPVPVGAAGWPVREVDSCAKLAPIKTQRLVVRVPLATGACIAFPQTGGVVVVATRKIAFDNGKGQPTNIPGFHGTVRSILESMNTGVVRVVQPAGERVKYLVLWDGNTKKTVKQILLDLFVAR